MGTSTSAEKIQGRGNDKALAWGVLLARGEGAGEESRMKSCTRASQRDAERSTMRAVGQGHCHQAQVMHSQAFALAVLMFCESCRDNSPDWYLEVFGSPSGTFWSALFGFQSTMRTW